MFDMLTNINGSFFRTDISYFDGMSETILSAGLIKPKPGSWTILKYYCDNSSTLL